MNTPEIKLIPGETWIEQVMYDDGSGQYHFDIHSLFMIGDEETVIKITTTSEETLKRFQFDPNTPVRIMNEKGEALGTTTIQNILD